MATLTTDFAQMMAQLMPQLKQMGSYYAPSGGYGAGMRKEAEETVRGGMARDIGQMVSTGMSSQFGARGTQMRAGSELSKLYKNIEDTRSQLWQQSVQPYAQIMAQMANMFRAKTTGGSSRSPIVQPQYSYAGISSGLGGSKMATPGGWF